MENMIFNNTEQDEVVKEVGEELKIEEVEEEVAPGSEIKKTRKTT